MGFDTKLRGGWIKSVEKTGTMDGHYRWMWAIRSLTSLGCCTWQGEVSRFAETHFSSSFLDLGERRKNQSSDRLST